MARVNWLLSEIWDLHQILREDIMRDRNRSISLADELTDRWEKAKFLGFGKDSRVYDSTMVFGDVEVGEDVWVGPFTILDGSGGLRIGSHCSIGAGSQISTHEGWKYVVWGGKVPIKYAPVVIEDYCVLNPMVVVTGGVTIGHHSVIGTFSLVNKNIPPYSKGFGVPCKVVGDTRDGIDSEGLHAQS